MIQSSVRSIFVCLLALFFIQSSADPGGQRNGLVNVEWLFKNLGNPGLVILDASTANTYKAGHIPGALNYDIYSYGPKEMPVPEIEKRLQSWGISPDKKIIIYDQGGTIQATRLAFSLDYYGFPEKNIYVVDGGASKWKEAGYTLTADISPTPEKGTFSIKELNIEVKSDLPEFLNASGDPAKNSLVEALDPSWHYGELNVFGRRGHVPNAILLPVADFYNPDKTFKSDEEIKKLLDFLGIEAGKNIYTHCGGGIAASVPYFAMKYLLGWPDVKLFPGSLLEWASDERELPLWTYDAPYLIRDAGWLKGWGGGMMRMYGISNLSLIDVRSPEAFSEEHVEYAVNLLTGDLIKTIKDPGKMAEALSLAGVTASSEAVIITGGGLTREAALAFVALEKAGQKKISVFMDDDDTWKQSGFKLISDKDAGNKAGASKDAAISPANYPVSSRNGIIVTDQEFERGIFPRIFIACGEKVPEKIPDEKIVHMPFKDLLNSDGAPLMAREVWNIMSKAGVRRYAELVCYSDDPGEAAVVYFTLRLMGFPDVRILIN